MIYNDSKDSTENLNNKKNDNKDRDRLKSPPNPR